MKHIRRKTLAVILAIMVAMSYTSFGFADEETPAGGEKTETVEPAETPEKPAEEAGSEKSADEPSGGECTEVSSEQEESAAGESVPADSSGEAAEGNSAAGEAAGGETSAVHPSDDAEAAVKANAVGGSSTYTEINNSTSLADGTYKAGGFSYSGGTGKAKLSCDKIIVSGGKANAVIRISSTYFTHFFTGTVDSNNNSDDRNADLYDPATGKTGEGVYKTRTDANGAYASIPVSIGKEMDLSGRTTAMSEPHWIGYKVTVTATSDDRTGEAEIQDGTYKPDSFRCTGGTGKASFDCEKVIVVDGKATAVFTTSSDYMTHVYMGEAATNSEDPSLYDPKTKKKGKGVYTIGDKKVSVPVTLNEEKPFSGRTTAMSEPHWIKYNYLITLTKDSEKISDSTDIPANPDESTEPSEQTDPSDKDKPKDPTEPTKKQKLTVGTWKVKATTKRKMFYLYPKNTDPAWVILKVDKNKKMTATITLSGDGYDYVYMGTPAQARSAGKSKWIKGKVSNGYYTFTVPVSALDKKLNITPHSRKYETDADPTTDPWRPDKWIIFYSKGAIKVKSGTTIKPSAKKTGSDKKSGTQTKFVNDKKADKESKWKDDKNKSTSAVDNSTSLKDGVYTPDKFSWSGGSGRLAYIRCNKITVKGGKAYATIEFASSHYDSLKANGRVYSKQGGGNSKFVIPIKLNANNTIIGRTTAMSQPHWIQYRIFVYKAGATDGKKGKSGEDGGIVNTKKLSDKAPELMGLENTGKIEIKEAELFRIFTYEQGIVLVSVDQAKGTALYSKKEKKAKDKVEYDEDGKPIAKTETEFVNELYENNVVNYLIVPEDVELPAGMEKECVIIQKPVDNAFIPFESGEKSVSALEEQSVLDKQEAFGEYDRPDFRQMILSEADLAILPSEVLPAKVTGKSTDEEIELSKEKKTTVKRLQTRYSSLSIPVMVDRSADEKTDAAAAEWVKVYGAIFGKDKQAEDIFDKYVKDNKKGKTENEEKTAQE